MSEHSFGFSIPQDQVPDVSYEELPDGRYPMQLVAAERKASQKDPRSWYMESKFRVIAGPFADKTHIIRFNVGNIKEDVKAFALSDLRKLSQAVGYTGPITGMDPYFGKPFCAEISSKSGKDKEGNPRREAQIKPSGWLPISEYHAAPMPTAGLTAQAAAMAPPTTNHAAPWGAQPAAQAA